MLFSRWNPWSYYWWKLTKIWSKYYYISCCFNWKIYKKLIKHLQRISISVTFKLWMKNESYCYKKKKCPIEVGRSHYSKRHPLGFFPETNYSCSSLYLSTNFGLMSHLMSTACSEKSTTYTNMLVLFKRFFLLRFIPFIIFIKLVALLHY